MANKNFAKDKNVDKNAQTREMPSVKNDTTPATSNNNNNAQKAEKPKASQSKPTFKRTHDSKPTDSVAIETANKALFESIDKTNVPKRSVSDYWEYLFYVHLKTKELYILSEEYSSMLKTFIQPINELKDAYEHVIRVCANMYMSSSDSSYTENEEYIKENLRNALAFECKAFFDTADYLSVILRKKINERLADFSYPEIASVWDDYNDIRLQMISATKEIAEIRTRRDETYSSLIEEDIEKYYNLTKDLLSWHIFVEEQVYPKLETRFLDI